MHHCIHSYLTFIIQMLPLQIETRRFFNVNSVKLLFDRAVVTEKSPFQSSEFELSYQTLEDKKSIETQVSFPLLTFASLGVIVGTLYLFGDTPEFTLIFYVASIVLLTMALALKKKLIIVNSFSGQNIKLYFTEKTKEEVIIFADQIIASANTYLIDKYSKIDKDLPKEDQLNNLVFLRDRNLLSDKEFEDLKNLLFGRDNQSNVGFK